MQKIRFIHTADIHWEKKQIAKCQVAWDELKRAALEGSMDIVFIAGDFWNSPQELSENGASNIAVEELVQLAKICSVVIIKGNRQHDEYGSLEILKKLNTKNPVYVCESVETIGLYINKEVKGSWISKYILLPYPFAEVPDLIIHCFSYPEKGHYLRDKVGMSIDEANESIQKDISNIFLGFAAIRAEIPGIPSVTMFHGSVRGAKISNGQYLVSQDIIISPDTLRLADSDYYALGHIHEWQEVAKNAWYSSSIYHNNFGEVNPKKIIGGVFEGRTLRLEHRTLTSIPLSLHEVWYDGELGCLRDKALEDDSTPDDWKGAVLRVRLTCSKEQRLIATDEKIKAMFPDAREYKIEYIQKTGDRIRTEGISVVKHLRDKLLLYCKSKGTEASKQALEFADKTESETRND